MKFLLDENFPRSANHFLVARGHEVIDFRGTADEGMADSEVLAMTQRLHAVLLTTDRDFFHTLHTIGKPHPGIIVVALRQPNRAAILARMEWALEHLREAKFPNRVFQLRDSTWVYRPPFDEED